MNIPPQQVEKYDDKKQYPRHDIAYKDGGIHNSKEKHPVSPAVVGDFFKKVSAKIMKGEITNMMALSKPVKLCTHYTLQEIIALDNMPTIYLDHAAYYTQKNDPIKRLQNIAAYVVSSIHIVPNHIFTKVPLDPTSLGETLQYIKKDSQTQFSSECVEIHPPVCRAYINSKNKEWIVEYTHKLWGKLNLPKMNSITCSAIGSKTICFRENDGTYTEIVSENMTQIMEGLLVGERTTRPTGTIRILDKKNKLSCEIKFNYTKNSTMKSLSNMMGGLWGSKKTSSEPQKRVDDVDCEIFKVQSFDPEEEKSEDFMKMSLSKGGGNYMEYFQMDGDVLWKQDQQFEQWVQPDNLLQSDLMNSELRMLMQMQDYDNSAKVQAILDEQSDKDYNLKKQARKAAKEKGVQIFEKQQ